MSAGRNKGIFRWVFFLWLLIHRAKASQCFCTPGDSSTPVHSLPNAVSETVGFMESKTCFHGYFVRGMEWIQVDKTEMFIRKHSLTACPEALVQITSGIYRTEFEIGNGVETFKTEKNTNSRLRREERRFLLENVNHAQCDFEVKSFCSWRNIQGGHDEFDWVLYQSSTPTDDTGPKFDHTLNNATGSYIFIESSAPRNTFDTAWIQSPDIDAKIVPVHCFRFWYHMFGSSIGRLNIYQVTHGIMPGNLVWSLTGEQGSTWMEGQVPVSSNHSYSMLISGIVGNGYQGDIAIDDVSVSPGYCEVKPSIASRTNVTNTVNGIWSTWSNYTGCTVSCGGGTQARLRKCEYTPGFKQGDPCMGHNNETQQCNNDMCPGDGIWTTWNNWSVCSTTCGNGSITRRRICVNPVPAAPFGKDCEGPVNETKACTNTTDCTVDGHWSSWTSWSTCSVTCGNGDQSRNRTCLFEQGKPRGHDCVGHGMHNGSCTRGNCPASSSTPTTTITTTSTTSPTTPSTTTESAPRRRCHVCNGPLQICESKHALRECPSGTDFCINELTNSDDASRTVNRRCGTYTDCNDGWYLTYSDDDKCTAFDENKLYTEDFYCEYCCNYDGCNELVNPPNTWTP